jgi:hypothetical protein
MTLSSIAIVPPLVPQPLEPTLVVVDSGVANYRHLVEGALPGAKVHVLSTTRDGVAQITAILKQIGQPVRHLHILSHGAPGEVLIGRGVLSATTLPQYAPQLRSWRKFLAHDAAILLYGCCVAKAPETDAALLHPLHQLTGATLYASQTPTGHSKHGGDWRLAYRLGDSNRDMPPLAVSVAAQQSWPGLLNTPPTLSFFNAIGNPDEETEFAIPLPTLMAQSDADDVDGEVNAFVVQAVTSSGTLSIGENEATASPWAAGSNDLIDTTHTAFWTPNTHINGSAVPAFSVVAQDNAGATSATPVVVEIMVAPVNDAPFIGDQPFALYDTAAATTPEADTTVPDGPALSFTDLSNGLAIAEFAGGTTQLNTLFANGIYAGYSNYNASGQLINAATFPNLDRAQGYLVSFALKVNEAINTDFGSDKNLDGLPDRSGFNVISISSDGQYGIELGFEAGRIWAQEDGTRQVDPSLEPDPTDANTSDRTLFTQAEGVNFATNSRLVNYDLLVQGHAYTLYADGTAILSGRLRDYTALEGFLDPYERPNFLFFGDNTPSAQGRVDIGDITVTPQVDSTTDAVTFDEAIHQGSTPTAGVLMATNPSLADIDGDAIASVVVTLTNPQGDVGERLFLEGQFTNVNYTLDSPNQITLTNAGNATTEAMESAIAAIRYQNNDDEPTTDDRLVTLAVSDGTTSTQAIATISVTPAAEIPFMVINEIDADTLGTDTAEFIELYDGGVGNTALDGLTVVLFNGNGDASYQSFDLTSFATDANGYFVLGNAAVPNAQITFANNLLQNGADAVALYAGEAADFPNGTAVTTANLLDAVVYDTNDSDDAELLTLLNSGQPQVNEGANGQSDVESLQRFPNGTGGQRQTDSFITGLPSPGAMNAATIEFASATFTDTEGAGTSIAVTLTRRQSVGRSTVAVSVIGGSGDPADYDSAAFPLTVTFEDTETSAVVTIPLTEDATVEGEETLELQLSNPTNAYVGPQSTATLTITDNDVAGFSIGESGNDTTVDESGTVTDSFTVQLDRQPLTDVQLTVTSDNPAAATAAPTTLTFTPQTWNQAQTVTVTGTDDLVLDGDQTSTLTIAVHAAASDDAFDRLASQTVTVTTTDDDVASFSIIETAGGTTVDESGTTDTFDVVLDRQPLTSVELLVTSGDPDEATVAPTSLTFTPETWNQAQTVTVTGTDDDRVDAAQLTTVTVSVNAANSDAAFATANNQTVTVTTTDDDAVGIRLLPTNPTLAVTEGGATDSYSLVLTAIPTADVVVDLSSRNGTVSLSTSSLTFTPDTWNQPQLVTVTAIEDDVAEGPHASTITQRVSSLDADYNGLTLPDIEVAITDNDSVGVTLIQSNETTLVSEAGLTDSYAVVLDSQPTAAVTITLTPDDQATLDKTTLIFTPTNWDQAQTVTVTAIDDSMVEADHSSTLRHTITSDDAQYAAWAIADLIASITDNDTGGVSLSQMTATVSEDGLLTATLQITLEGEPRSPVVLDLTSANPNEVISVPSRLTLDRTNWDTGVSVEIQGVRDVVVDGDQTTQLTVSVDAASSDDAFARLADQEISVTTLDNNTAAAVFSQTTATVSETGVTDTVTIALTSRPSAEVTLTFDGGDQLASPTPTTFTADNWDTPQTVTIAARNDTVIEGHHTGTLTTTVSSDDAHYDGFAIAPITVAIADDDRPTDLIFTFNQYVTFQAIDEGILPRFDEELYLLANPDVAAAVQAGGLASGAQHYDLYGRAEGRSLLPLQLEIGGLKMADFFDETYYLDQYADVAEAVRQGALAYGYEHFLRAGIAEGRNPSRYYNEEVYLGANSDVAIAVGNGSINSGLEHYLQAGHLEDRLASNIFDANDYLLDHPDVATAIQNGNWLSAFEHFLEAGAHESRLPVLLYEESTYLQRNADVADAVNANQLASGLEHYVSSGQGEGRDPSVSFDESAYLAANPDVTEAVLQGAISSGMEHYFRAGRAEGRALD